MSRVAAPELRTDLVWRQRKDERRWIVQDPIAGAFFSFTEQEHAVTQLLNGRRDGATLLREIAQLGVNETTREEWLHAFLLRLNQCGLLRRTGASVRSVPRASWLRWPAFIGSLLSVRVRLFNPSGVLPLLRGLSVCVFHPVTLFFVLAVALVTAFAVLQVCLSRPNVISGDLFRIQGDRIVMLWVAYLATKSIHELGHLLACAHWRVRCSEAGLMLLLGTPCFYCDTTDAWRLNSKWSRMAISLAGVYFELVVATTAAIVWMITGPGALHSIAASVMLVASVGTLFVNANPFFKYDGYFALSDFLGVPNLADQSQDALRWSCVAFFSKADLGKPHLDLPMGWLVVYGLAATTYRAFVLMSLGWIAWMWLLPAGYGLPVLLFAAAMLISCIWAGWRFLKLVSLGVLVQQRVRPLRIIVVTSLAIWCGWIAWNWPLPSYVAARGISANSSARSIYLMHDGLLKSITQAGQFVQTGEELLRLDGPELRYERIRTQAEIDRLVCRLEQLQERKVVDSAAAFEIAPLKELISGYRERLAGLESQLDDLSISATESGRFVPSRFAVEANTLQGQTELNPRRLDERFWTGKSWQRGTEIGSVVQGGCNEIRAIVSEESLAHVQLGQEVVARWDHARWDSIKGTVVAIDTESVKTTPSEFVRDPWLISVRDDQGALVPESPHYWITVRIDGIDESSMERLRAGAKCSLWLDAPNQTLVDWIVKFARRSLDRDSRG